MSRLAAPPTIATHPPATAFTTLEVVKGEKTHVTPPSYADDAAVNLSKNSLKVLHRRYLRRDIDGNLLESVAGMFYRVAHHVAGAEAAHNGDVEATTKTFYDLLTNYASSPTAPHSPARARRWANWRPVLCCPSPMTWDGTQTGFSAPYAWRP